MSTWNANTLSYLNNNHTLHESSVVVDRRGNAISGEYLLDVSKGKIPGATIFFISGRNRDVSINTEETIWETGGMYPWETWDAGANTLHIVSDSTSDTNVTIQLVGLDANYLPITKVVIANGTTSVDTGSTQFIRMNQALVVGNKDCSGTISIRYGSPTGNVIGQIGAKAQITKMGIYTVPAGYTAYTYYASFSVAKNTDAELNTHRRPFGRVFVDVFSATSYESELSLSLPIPSMIPEKTDIDHRVDFASSNNTKVYINQQLLLINNNYL